MRYVFLLEPLSDCFKEAVELHTPILGPVQQDVKLHAPILSPHHTSCVPRSPSTALGRHSEFCSLPSSCCKEPQAAGRAQQLPQQALSPCRSFLDVKATNVFRQRTVCCLSPVRRGFITQPGRLQLFRVCCTLFLKPRARLGKFKLGLGFDAECKEMERRRRC